ncbi:hypothetical protein HDU76_006318 [Blyttiomyces sp. JEL0837]|nr:hypothetical protein HDU76_006318 [Blyttiomyces sp. JEL0837]
MPVRNDTQRKPPYTPPNPSRSPRPPSTSRTPPPRRRNPRPHSLLLLIILLTLTTPPPQVQALCQCYCNAIYLGDVTDPDCDAYTCLSTYYTDKRCPYGSEFSSRNIDAMIAGGVIGILLTIIVIAAYIRKYIRRRRVRRDGLVDNYNDGRRGWDDDDDDEDNEIDDDDRPILSNSSTVRIPARAMMMRGSSNRHDEPVIYVIHNGRVQPIRGINIMGRSSHGSGGYVVFPEPSPQRPVEVSRYSQTYTTGNDNSSMISVLHTSATTRHSMTTGRAANDDAQIVETNSPNHQQSVMHPPLPPYSPRVAGQTPEPPPPIYEPSTTTRMPPSSSTIGNINTSPLPAIPPSSSANGDTHP